MNSIYLANKQDHVNAMEKPQMKDLLDADVLLNGR